MAYNLANVVQNKDRIDFDAMEKIRWEDAEGQKPVFKDTREMAFENWSPVYKKGTD